MKTNYLVRIKNAKFTIETSETSELSKEQAETLVTLLTEAVIHYVNHSKDMVRYRLQHPQSLEYPEILQDSIIISELAFEYFTEDIEKIIKKGKTEQDNLYANAIDSLIDENLIVNS